MNRWKTFILISLTSLFLSHCSYNNGGDTELWGTWHLSSITIDGTEDTAYQQNFFWKFQGDVILIQQLTGAHERYDRYGTWSLSSNRSRLTINFGHKDDEYQPGTGIYQPSPDIYIYQSITTFDILTLNNSTLVLKMTDTETGTIYNYFLEKR